MLGNILYNPGQLFLRNQVLFSVKVFYGVNKPYSQAGGRNERPGRSCKQFKVRDLSVRCRDLAVTSAHRQLIRALFLMWHVRNLPPFNVSDITAAPPY